MTQTATNALLFVIVLGTAVLAVGINIAAVISFLWRRR
jgi:uncharacterized membrane protein YdjX (TVP38/TMEM64 family)